MAAKTLRESVDQISGTRSKITAELAGSLNEEGKIDILTLRESKKSLSDVFELLTLSKTYRDDPTATAKDIARLIAARDPSNQLASALDKLEVELKRAKSEAAKGSPISKNRPRKRT